MRYRINLLILFSFLLIILASFLFRAPSNTHPQGDADDLSEQPPVFVIFLDCIRGSSTIIDRGDHEIIIDACGGDELLNFLKRYPDIIKEPLELAVVTQPSPDSFRGFIGSLNQIKKVEEVWDPGFDRRHLDSSDQVMVSYAKFKDQISQIVRGGVVKRPLEQFHAPAVRSNKIEHFQLPSMPDITFTLLSSDSNPEYPRETARAFPDQGFLANNASIVMVIEVSGFRLLFPGAIWGKLPQQDAATALPAYAEGKLLELEARHPGALRADLILAPRGGSESSSTQKFIDAVAPQLAIFSANPRSLRPAASVVARYERTAHVFSTGVHVDSAVDNVICTNWDEDFGPLHQQLRCSYGATPVATVESEVWLSGELWLPYLDSWRGFDASKTRALDRGEVIRYLARRPERQREDEEGADYEALRGAEALHGADLSGIDLSNENFNGRSLAKSNLSWANLAGSNLAGASLAGAMTEHMYFDSTTVVRGANLTGTSLFAKDMPKDFRGTVLTDATLQGVDLKGAIFVGSNLDGARIKDSDLTDAVFEPLPGSIPSYTEMAVARKGYLKTLKFETSPHALVELREAFKKAGLRDQERELTYAIERERNSRKSGLDYWFRRIFFDLTSQYGMSPNRPLKIIGIFIFLFAIPYIVALFTRTRGGIWMVSLPDRVETPDTKNSGPRRLTTNFTWSRPFSARRLGQWFRVFFLGLYFSFLSAFQLGYRDFNVGSWILRLQAKESTLKATGWVRVVSGIQSLTSVYLLALWVLLYFGNPFE